MKQHCFNDETKEKVPLWMPIRETGDTTYNTTFVTGEKAKFLLFVEAAPTASFGYALFPDDAQSSDSLFSYANAAMNEVKKLDSSEHILHFTSELFST